MLNASIIPTAVTNSQYLPLNNSIMEEASAIVKAVSSILEKLICGNNDNVKSSSPFIRSGQNSIKEHHNQLNNDNSFIKFRSCYAPDVSIQSYLGRIKRFSRCSDSCLVMALVYIDTLIESNNLVLTKLNAHRLLITSVMLAAKFHDDLYYNNAYYSKFGGLPLLELNSLEIELLQRLNFSLYVAPHSYDTYSRQLQNYILCIDIVPGSQLFPSNNDNQVFQHGVHCNQFPQSHNISYEERYQTVPQQAMFGNYFNPTIASGEFTGTSTCFDACQNANTLNNQLPNNGAHLLYAGNSCGNNLNLCGVISENAPRASHGNDFNDRPLNSSHNSMIHMALVNSAKTCADLRDDYVAGGSLFVADSSVDHIDFSTSIQNQRTSFGALKVSDEGYTANDSGSSMPPFIGEQRFPQYVTGSQISSGHNMQNSIQVNSKPNELNTAGFRISSDNHSHFNDASRYYPYRDPSRIQQPPFAAMVVSNNRVPQHQPQYMGFRGSTNTNYRGNDSNEMMYGSNLNYGVNNVPSTFQMASQSMLYNNSTVMGRSNNYMHLGNDTVGNVTLNESLHYPPVPQHNVYALRPLTPEQQGTHVNNYYAGGHNVFQNNNTLPHHNTHGFENDMQKYGFVGHCARSSFASSVAAVI